MSVKIANQQQFFGVVRSVQNGQRSLKSVSPSAAQAAKRMSVKDADEFPASNLAARAKTVKDRDETRSSKQRVFPDDEISKKASRVCQQYAHVKHAGHS